MFRGCAREEFESCDQQPLTYQLVSAYLLSHSNSLTSLPSGHHPGEHVGLKHYYDRHHDREPDGPRQDQPEEVALLALKARRAGADGQVLRADHLSQYTARGISSNCQDRA